MLQYIVFPVIPSLAINDGLVVTPSKTPNACASISELN
jgi:hypothetical protein